MSDRIPIGFPPRTRVYHLERVVGVGWRVWIAVDPRTQNRATDKWLGTYLLLCDNGAVQRITHDTDGSELIMDIKEGTEHD